jgi:hypothetical protein
VSKIVELVKPVVFAFIGSREVKEFVIQLLEKYVSRTDNSVDDVAVQLIKEKLLPNE